MSKTNVFALFGILFFSSILLGNGIYSGQVFALENQTGTENEAEVEADIEQENKCKKDTECENENEINNSLNIVNPQQNNTQTEPVTQTCEECFTTILSSEQLENFLINFSEVGPEVTTVEELCDVIERDQGLNELDYVIGITAENSGLTEEQYLELIQCLQDAGLDVNIPTPE